MKMLKTLFLILILTWSEFIFAQFPIDKESGAVKYTEVIELPEMDEKEIHDKAKFWVVSTLKSGDNMIELSGSSSDKIVAAGNILLDSIRRLAVTHGRLPYLNFKFIVYIKKCKLKYSIENFLLTLPSEGKTTLAQMGSNVYGKAYLKAFRKNNTAYTDRHIKAVENSFINYMKKEVKDDW